MISAPLPLHFEGTPVRVVTRHCVPWFVLADVCRVLGIENPRNTASRLDYDEKGVATVDTLGGPQSVLVVNESGLYAVVVTSRKPEARRFRRWVTGEVLPAIRRTGAYLPSAPAEPAEEIALRAIAALHDALMRKQAALAGAQPKAAALERLSGSAGAVSITEAAKTLAIGPKALMEWLLANGWVYRRPPGSSPLAYQRRLECGWLEHRMTEIRRSDGEQRMATQVRVTARGLAELAQRVPGARTPAPSL